MNHINHAKYEILSIQKHPELKKQAAEWFHQKWRTRYDKNVHTSDMS